MAIQLGATDTDIVICALEEYRHSLVRCRGKIAANDPDGEDLRDSFNWDIAAVDRMIKSFTRSYVALERLGRW
jgi:hypothetical protein